MDWEKESQGLGFTLGQLAVIGRWIEQARQEGKAYWEPAEHHKDVWRNEGQQQEQARIEKIIEEMRDGDVYAGVSWNSERACKWCGAGEVQFHAGDCKVLKATIWNSALDSLKSRLLDNP